MLALLLWTGAAAVMLGGAVIGLALRGRRLDPPDDPAAAVRDLDDQPRAEP